jgi:cysteine-rich repeat protein
VVTMSEITATGVCMDGLLDAGEECDDGNAILLDGCSTTCEIEDPSESVWLCSTVANALSVCCPVLINPVTFEKVCDCGAAVQPVESMGFTITPQCTKRDINECNTNNGNCHVKATCTNYDAAVNSLETYECICPPGWNGDGVSECDINTYDTDFKVVQYDVTTVDGSVVTNHLQSSGVIPQSVAIEKILSKVDPFFFANPQRRLLATQTGVEITVTIMSASFEAMNNLTASINMTALPAPYTMRSAPVSTVLVSGRGLVNTMLGGFAVDTIIFNSVANTWEIDSRYVPNIPNTIASPFISKIGAAPYSPAVMQTFEISKFPCLEPGLPPPVHKYFKIVFSSKYLEKLY